MSDGTPSDQPIDKVAGQDKDKKNKAVSNMAVADLFILEKAFPDAQSVFRKAVVPSIDQSDALVVIDTNSLLLPYRLASSELASLQEAYKKLADENRLFIPARVAREFISNRDGRLGELIKGLLDEGSKVSPALKPLPLHLRSVPGHTELMKAAEDLNLARSEYLRAAGKVQTAVAAWRGDDPVTVVYAQVFIGNLIVEHDGDDDTVATEWAARLRHRIPPGFKDSNKDDTGIGDFLIWKTILKIGRQHKKDMVFVTGEEKTDWMVRSGKAGIYPRPELIAEYRLETEGRSLRLSSLTNLLEEMNAPADVVREVGVAEEKSNAQVRATAAELISEAIFSSRRRSEVTATFDYSTNDGIMTISTVSGDFDIRFSKGSDQQIYLIRTGRAARIARVKNAQSGNIISIDSYDTSSSTYMISVGDGFLVENASGDLLVGRLTHLTDDTRGSAVDEVRFTYSIWFKASLAVMP